MTVSNRNVVKAWHEGNKATGSRMWTNGEKLYSYARVIGFKMVFGQIVIRRVIRSVTTTRHINTALRYLDELGVHYSIERVKD